MSEIRSQATPARDELAERLMELWGWLGPDAAKLLVEQVEDAGWSKPRTVNSATELGALRVGTRGFTPETWEVWWLRRVGREPHWEGSGGMYSRASDLLAEHGPMTVLFTPGDAG